MLRSAVVVVGVVGVIAVLAGCSSSSKPKVATGTSAGRTVLPNGTVVTSPAGSSTSSPGLEGNAGTASSQPAAGRSAQPQNTPVPGTTAAAVATSGAATVAAAPQRSATQPAAAATLPPIAPTPANLPPADGLSLTLPDSPQGDFTGTVQLTGAPGYRGFSVQLTFDASLLSVTGIDQGGLLGTPDKSFCPPPVIKAGSGLLACTILGPSNSTASGALAVFHFHVLAGGSATLHFTTFAEGGSNYGSFLVGTDINNPTPLTVPLHNAKITVAP